MVVQDTHNSNPELFDCPFSAAAVSQYTFREVRQNFGDKFRDKFWPVFQARAHPTARPCTPGCAALRGSDGGIGMVSVA